MFSAGKTKSAMAVARGPQSLDSLGDLFRCFPGASEPLQARQLGYSGWTVQPFLDVRIAVLNGTLAGSFRGLYPAFQADNDIIPRCSQHDGPLSNDIRNWTLCDTKNWTPFRD